MTRSKEKASKQASKEGSKEANKQGSTKARSKPGSQEARKQASKQASKQAWKQASVDGPMAACYVQRSETHKHPRLHCTANASPESTSDERKRRLRGCFPARSATIDQTTFPRARAQGSKAHHKAHVPATTKRSCYPAEASDQS